MNIEFLGGAREVGRSAVLIDDAVLLDYGLLASDPPQYPTRDPEPAAVIISHGHLDHVGAVPALLKGSRRPTIHWTPPTAAFTRVLANDTLKLHGTSPRCPFSSAAVEAGWTERVRTTIWEGGTVLAPAFAIGRTQELMLVAARADQTPYVDGMGIEVTQILKQHPAFLRDPAAFQRAAGASRFVTGRDGQRERIAADPGLIITTSGMLTGGPAHSYLPTLRTNPTNAVTLTGYQVAGTPGRMLQERGRLELNGRVRPVSARVSTHDFSAHADREGLRSLLNDYRDAKILVNHGDRCVPFAASLEADGFDASAPALGETVSV